MADLFLDTAFLEIAGPQSVASRLKASGYDRIALRDIFFDEVLPSFAFNLLDTAGEWAGWHEDLVRARVLETISANGPSLVRRAQAALVRSAVSRDWQTIEAFL